jgi:hypothetical protein
VGERVKTKLGYPTDRPPTGDSQAEATRHAPTVIGHAAAEEVRDAAREAAAGAAAAAPPAQPEVAAPSTDAPPAGFAGPAHTGKSNFPARAGFWGRRDRGGDLRPGTDPGLTSEERAALGLSIERRRAIRVGAIAATSLVAALAAGLILRKIRRAPPPPPPLSTPLTRAPRTPAAPPAAPAPSPAPAASPARATKPLPGSAPKRRTAPRPSRGSLSEDDILAPSGL